MINILKMVKYYKLVKRFNSTRITASVKNPTNTWAHSQKN